MKQGQRNAVLGALAAAVLLAGGAWLRAAPLADPLGELTGGQATV